MVLLSNESLIIIKKNHLLKCLERKNSFKIVIEPLTESFKEKAFSNDDKNIKFENLTNSDIETVFHSKQHN